MDRKESIAYLLGALRDGNLYESKKHNVYRIRIYQKNKTWLKIIDNLFSKVIGEKTIWLKDPRKDLWYIQIGKKHLYEKIRKIVKSSYEIPEVIKNSSLNCQVEYVRGFFDAEGGILRIENYEHNKILLQEKLQDIRINFGQINKESLNFIKMVLEKLSISSGKICGPYFKNNNSKPFYQLNIYGIKNLIKFHDFVGTLHPLKQMRMKKIIAYKRQ